MATEAPIEARRSLYAILAEGSDDVPGFQLVDKMPRSHRDVLATVAEWVSRQDSMTALDMMESDDVPIEARRSRDVVLAAVSKDVRALHVADEMLRSDRAVLASVVEWVSKQHSMTVLPWLKNAPIEARRSREVILAAVGKDVRALSFADEMLRADRAVLVKVAEWVSRQDSMTVLHWLEHAPIEARRSRDVILAAVGKDVRALNFADEMLKSDPDVLCSVAECVSRQDSMTVFHWLEHAPIEARRSRDVILAAVGKDVRALSFADEMLRSDPDVLVKVAEWVSEQDSMTVLYWFVNAPIEARRSRDVILAAVSKSARALPHADETVRGDCDVLASVADWVSKQNSMTVFHWLEYDAPIDARRSRDVILAAVSKDVRALNFADEMLKSDPDVLAKVAEWESRQTQARRGRDASPAEDAEHVAEFAAPGLQSDQEDGRSPKRARSNSVDH